MKNVLLDTNIIIDALTSREPFCHKAEEVFICIASDEAYGFITANTVTDIYYLLRKYIKDSKLTKTAIEHLLETFSVLEVNAEDIFMALSSSMSDFEDAVLAFTGKRHGIDCIITRNVKVFTDSPVKAVEPDEFLREI